MKCKETECSSPRPHETGTLRKVLHLGSRNPLLDRPFLPAWHGYRIFGPPLLLYYVLAGVTLDWQWYSGPMTMLRERV